MSLLGGLKSLVQERSRTFTKEKKLATLDDLYGSQNDETRSLIEVSTTDP
jgi:hypothetical protein